MNIVRLEQNYRSTKRILRVADELIGHNIRRKKKDLFTENDEGLPVRLVAYAGQDDEAADIAEQIREAVAAGRRKPSDFAIFYRVNALSRALEQAMRSSRRALSDGPRPGVLSAEGNQGRAGLSASWSTIRVTTSRWSGPSIRRPRGIGRKTMERLFEYAYRYGMPLLEAARDAEHVDGLPRAGGARRCCDL